MYEYIFLTGTFFYLPRVPCQHSINRNNVLLCIPKFPLYLDCLTQAVKSFSEKNISLYQCPHPLPVQNRFPIKYLVLYLLQFLSRPNQNLLYPFHMHDFLQVLRSSFDCPSSYLFSKSHILLFGVSF